MLKGGVHCLIPGLQYPYETGSTTIIPILQMKLYNLYNHTVSRWKTQAVGFQTLLLIPSYIPFYTAGMFKTFQPIIYQFQPTQTMTPAFNCYASLNTAVAYFQMVFK